MATATTAAKPATEVTYHTTVREMPTDERPRERLERYGAGQLQVNQQPRLAFVVCICRQAQRDCLYLNVAGCIALSGRGMSR